MFMVKFIGYTCEAVTLTGTGMAFELDGFVEAVTTIIGQVTDDKAIWAYALITAVTMAVVYIIGKFSFDYALYIAIAAGAVAEIVIAFLCGTVIGTGLNIGSVIIGTVIGVVLALILQCFRAPLDYSRKEYLQFEDDDFYYYVKAVPKAMARETEHSGINGKAE
jgi:hypothetical protein